METQTDDNNNSKNNLRSQLESRIETQRNTQINLLASLQTLVPNIVTSLDLSLQLLSSFNNKPFTPTPPLPTPTIAKPDKPDPNKPLLSSSGPPKPDPKLSPVIRPEDEKFLFIDDSGGPLSVVRAMVAVCLLQRVPFTPIDSSTVLRKLENDESVTSAEKSALRELGGESGAILAVELALRSMAEDDGGVELEEFVITGKSRVMVLGIDRSKLVKELPENAEFLNKNNSQNQTHDLNGGGGGGGGGGVSREMWMMGRGRGGMGMIHGRPSGMSVKIRTEEDDLKDLEAMLNKKSFMEMQKSKTGEELLDLIHRPTARETAMAARVIGISFH